MSIPLSILIVEKTGILKPLSIKDYKEEELYKKCGFKKGEDFIKQVEWNVKYEGTKYGIHVFAKTEGRANSENKYDFPPPIDTKLFFGSCAIVAFTTDNHGTNTMTPLSINLWLTLYEKLFGGFEDLALTTMEDEQEEDELLNVPKEKKTKQGYLKDGFVVDSGTEDENESDDSNEESELEEELEEEEEEVDMDVDDIGSELSEEMYEYDSELE
jgi:hypothetical protein